MQIFEKFFKNIKVFSLLNERSTYENFTCFYQIVRINHRAETFKVLAIPKLLRIPQTPTAANTCRRSIEPSIFPSLWFPSRFSYPLNSNEFRQNFRNQNMTRASITSKLPSVKLLTNQFFISQNSFD